MQVLKQQLIELNQIECCEFCYEGEETITRAILIIENVQKDYNIKSNKDKLIRPIKLMLLDHAMPRKNGIEVVEAIRKFIKSLNEKHTTFVTIVEPSFVFLTAYASKAFKQHLQTIKV